MKVLCSFLVSLFFIAGIYCQTINPSGPINLCQGSSQVLTVTGVPGGTTFQWQNPLGINISGENSISYTANSAGNYYVILNTGTMPGDTLGPVIVTVVPKPTASFTFNNNVCSGISVQFNSNVTNGTAPYTYAWTFGDGGVSALPNPSHLYNPALGCGIINYTATLVVTDANGCSGTFASTVNIKQAPDVQLQDLDPISPFSNCENSPTPGNPNFTLTVNNISPSMTCIISYTIAWGDGFFTSGTGSIFPATHTYTQLGAFNLVVTVLSNNGCSNAQTYLVVNQSNPAGSLGTLGNTVNLCAPATVRFTISNWQLNSTGTTYNLNFGDGDIVTLAHPLNPGFITDTVDHIYATTSCPASSFTATLTVTNACGSTPYTAGGIKVLIKPTASFTVAPNPGCVNQSICFTNTSIAGSGINCSATTTNSWNFGDGSPISNLQSPCHIYSAPGVYTVTLTISNYCGPSVTTRQVCIAAPITPAFTIDNSVGCSPLAVSTNNTTNISSSCSTAVYQWSVSYAPGFCGTTSLWNYTNGTNASSTNPSFSFINPGTYTITLTVTSVCGTVTTNRVIAVKKPPTVTINPIANSCAPTTIQPVANAVNCGTLAMTYLWSFPGGTPSSATTLNPGTIVYSTPGTYTITLSVTNECGTTTTSIPVTVNVTPSPVVPANIIVCAGATVGPLSFTSVPAGATFTWTNSNTSIGLGASGSSNPIPSFVATNATGVPITANINVTATLSGCSSSNIFTITVNPIPTVNVIPNQTVCAGASTAAIVFSGAVAGSIYNWTNSNTSIGLPASGTGNIASFTATNNGTSPVVATIVVTPTFTNAGVTCPGTPRNFTITVNPIPTVNAVNNQTVCAGAMTTAITFTGAVAGSSYSWINSNTAIGLGAGGTGNIAAFTAVNGGTTPITGTITVTPTYTNGGATCSGTPINFTITVNPSPTVNAVTNQTLCAGSSTAAINFSGNLASTVYNWTNSNTSIGLPASGTGNIASFTATNNGTSPVVATIVVTPTFTNAGVTCPGTPRNFTITVNPIPTVNAVNNQTVCAGAMTTAITFTGAVAGSSYSWINSNTAIGLGAGGTGNIAAFTAVNGGTTPITGTITVTPTYTNGGATCSGTPINFTITVNPSPTVNAVTNQTLCAGSSTAAINFSGNLASTVYNWTNSNTSIGLPASGTGDIASFIAINGGTTGVVATITVTPVFTNAGVTCPGTPRNFTITVNPIPTVNAVNNQTVCAGAMTTAITFTGAVAGSSYSWINSNTAIGLGAGGTGNIAAFTAVNGGTTPITGTITVTPTYTNGGATCSGTPINFTITVNPSPTVNAVTNQTLCAGSSTAAINFSGNLASTVYNWTNSNTSIGLPASGTGNIASFTATNNGTSPVVATIVVTPTFTNAGVTCPGSSKTFTITVNPTAQVTQPANVDVCNGQLATVTHATVNTGGVTTYTWTNSLAAIGLPISGTGNISFNAVNNGTAPIVATIVVTPTFTNAGVSCTGPSMTYTITVNPGAQVNQPTSQVVCNGNPTAAITFTTNNSGGATIYSWTNTNPGIGIAATGTGDIASFIAVNNGTSPIIATIVVTPSFNNGGAGCSGGSKTFTITVNPTAQVTQPTNQVLCNGAATTAISFVTTNTGGSTLYNWTNTNASIGLAATGSGNIASFTAVNNGTSPIVATIVVTPSFTNAGITCSGPTKTFTITVNPTAQLTQPANVDVCNGQLTTVTYATVNTGGTTTYTWTNTLPAIGLPAAGSGNISFNAINNGTTPIVATIVVTPTFTNAGVSCSGPTKTYTITVNPSAQVNQPSDQVLCNGGTTTAISFTTTNTSGSTLYNWTNTNSSIGLAATGSGDIASFTAVNNGTSPIVATIVVTPSFTNAGITCSGPTKTFTITVNPTAQLTQPANVDVCNGQLTTVTYATVNTGGTTTYSWTNSLPAIGLPANGTGNISFNALNNGTTPIVATIVVTPTFTNAGVSCSGPAKTYTITVNPGAQVNQPTSQVVCNGDATTAITFTTNNGGGSTIYSWTNSNPGIGLAATGTGGIASFTATNNGTSPVVATIVVTPTFTNGGAGCPGSTKTFTITVNPTAQVIQPANQVVCNGATTSTITFTTNNTGGSTAYNWINSNAGIGIAASGTGDIASFTAINNGTSPVVATIVVTPTFTNAGVTCPGSSKTFTITVNPTAQVTQPANVDVCNSQPTTVSYGTVNAGGTTVYTWTNSLPAIGLPATGTGNISFNAVNNGTAPIVATIVVTPTFTNASVSCSGPAKTYTITVNPSAQVNQPTSQVVCNGDATTAISFTTNNTVGATSYTWTNSNPAIGLLGTGTGNIASFTATNNGTSPVVATIVVTPTFTNAGVTCPGSSKTFTITVNPDAQVTQPANVDVCNSQPTTVSYGTVNAGGTTVYTWTNSLPAIGLPATGTGNISFNAVNNGTAPIVATIVVTPTFTNAGVSCSGPAKTYTITVNPGAQVNQPTSQVVCNGDATTAISFTTNNTVGATSYTWTNSNPAIGLLGTGTGNIASFTATNNGTSPVVATIVVTPTFTNAGVTCPGSSKTFTITVNPTAQVTQPANVDVCNSQPTTVSYGTVNAGGTTVYTWTNSLPAIGLPATGTGNISFNAVNNGTAPIVATIVVTPTFTNAGVSCSGPAKTYTITVNPGAQVNQPTSQVVCNGDATTAITFTTNNGGGSTIYSWTNSNPGIGLAATGTGGIASFTATNNGTSPVVATIVVTPTFTNGGAGCPGSTKTFTITVNPTAQVIQPANQVVCNGATTSTITFTTNNTGGSTAYNWINSNAGIGIAASGTGDIASFTAINNGTSPVVATIVVTPTFTNAGVTCPGSSKTFTITVNPTAQVTQPANVDVCNSQPTTVSYGTVNAGGTTVYTWTNSLPAIGLPATGTGNISFNAVNNGTAPIVATIVVTPTFTNASVSCSGPAKTYTITVNPSAQVNQPTSQVVCNGDATTAISFTTNNTVGATSYTWTNSNPAIGLLGTGTGNIASFTATNNGTSPVVATIVVTPTFTNAGVTCPGSSKTFTITVNPDAKSKFTADTTIGCAPFNISQHLNVVRYTNANNEALYKWYANGILIGTGLPVPNYSITQPGDTVIITLVAVSKYGCKDDTSSLTIYTVQRPVPSFTTSADTLCGPASILFTNTTTPINVLNNSSYFWDFGNGTTSTAVQPGSILFLPNPTFGDTVYIVKLKVTTVCDTITISKSILIQSKPKALFTPNRAFGCSPFTVIFTNTSKGFNNAYVWNFGDGTILNTNSIAPVSHTYNTGIRDTFYVKLRATNNCGSDSFTYAIVVSPNTINLLFGVNGTQLMGCVPHTVSFINNSSGASSFFWNFGDGSPIVNTTRNIDTVVHTYLIPGVFTATLRGTNGCADTSASLIITVFQKPLPSFTADKYLLCIGDTVRFTNLTDSATSYLWQFGDGGTSTLLNPSHRYSVPGLYRVKLTAYRGYPSGSVCSDTTSRLINVLSSWPGIFDLTDSTGPCAPFTITFFNRNLPAVSATWDFGDGTTGNGNTITHTYQRAGTYLVRLVTVAPGGCTYTSQKTVTISGPDGVLLYNGGFYCNSQTVRFEATVSNTDTLLWNFGDGNILATTQRIVFHSYAFAGSYVPKVTLLSNSGCQFPIQGIDTIKIDYIKSGFSWTEQRFCGYTKVQFRDTSNAYFGLQNFSWDFGDGTFGSGNLVSHDYTAAGNYTVKLIVTGNSNCKDTISKPISIVINSKPVASIQADTSGCAYLPVTFNGIIQSNDPVNIISWSVSNGVTGSGTPIIVNFALPGTYTVRLVTGTIYGCYDTAYHFIRINPTPNVTTNNNLNLCLGNTVQLITTGASQYLWSPSQGLSCNNCPNPIASPTTTTAYVVRGMNTFGCNGYDTVVISVIQPIKVTVSSGDSICIGKSVQLMASGASKYLWTPSIGLSATNIPNPVATPTSTITYKVVGYDNYNCFTDTGYVTVAVGLYPTVNLGSDLSLSTGTQLTLNSTIQNGPIRDWLWTPSNNLSCNTCPKPVATIKENVTYIVKATTYYGCSALDTIKIKVFCEGSQVFIPNTFTPDGDGLNDIMMVRGTGILTVKSFRIFNRWGAIVFERNNFPPNNPAYGWDGKVSGKPVPPDVFVYTAEAICDNGTPYIFKGNITIIK